MEQPNLVALGGGALAVWGFSRRSVPGAVIAAIGGGVALAAINGRRTAAAPVEVRRTVTIAADPATVYDFWRRLENLPRLVDQLEGVTALDDRRSRWRARGPLGLPLEWEAEIVDDHPPDRIAWRANDGELAHEGSVRLASAPSGRGTEITVTLRYVAPAARAGTAVATLFGDAPAQVVREALRRVKSMIEAGEVPTTDGQPSARVEAQS